MFDRGAPCEEYCGKNVAKASQERYGCRSGHLGTCLAGSSENIRPVVAFAESYHILVLYWSIGSLIMRLPFFIRK